MTAPNQGSPGFGFNQADMAIAYVWLGEKETVLEILARQLRQPENPPYAKVHELKLG